MDAYSVGDSDKRNWGHYTVTKALYDGDVCTRCEKDITVNHGYMLSVQSHDKRFENWLVISGCLTVVLNGDIVTLNVGQEISIAAGAIHTMANLGYEPCVVHEVQTRECAESDIHRYWDPNGRKVELSEDPRVLASIESCKKLLSKLKIVRKERTIIKSGPN